MSGAKRLLSELLKCQSSLLSIATEAARDEVTCIVSTAAIFGHNVIDRFSLIATVLALIFVSFEYRFPNFIVRPFFGWL